MNRLLLLFLTAATLLLPACQSYDPAAKIARDAAIKAEPKGDYYIGRRYHTNGTRFWGYLRRPGELWEKSQLVVTKEDGVRNPDRVPEDPVSGPAHGFDHNYEYRVWGGFTGRKVYDPNADLELPLFRPTRWQLMDETPGFLFDPRDKYDPRYLPAREARRRGY
jgi:hypothetical protein